MKTLKTEIKELVAIQKELKQQRKTINFNGIRTVEPYSATVNHLANRSKLRIMYMAYGLLRGKDAEQIDAFHTSLVLKEAELVMNRHREEFSNES